MLATCPSPPIYTLSLSLPSLFLFTRPKITKKYPLLYSSAFQNLKTNKNKSFRSKEISSILLLYMADSSRNDNSGSRHQPSRLQRRRPASLQISPASSWNVAIPLLSPLATSPTTTNNKDLTMRVESRQEQRSAEGDKPVVFKKWQHPAAPFCYESAPIKASFFVPV